MNKIARIGAVAALPLLAGCMDLEQGISVEPDGTVTFVMEVAIDTEMLQMMAAMGEGDPAGIASICEDMDSADVPESFTVTEEEFERDGDTVCRTTAVGPLEELAAESPDEMDETGGVVLTSEGNGVYYFETLMISEDSGLGDVSEPEIAAMFEGRTIMFYVTAPNIIETNGDLDGNTASLTIPTIDLMSGTGEAYSLTVRFSL